MTIVRLEGESLKKIASPFVELLTLASSESLILSPFDTLAYKVDCRVDVNLVSRITGVFEETLQLRPLKEARFTGGGQAKVWEVLSPQEIQGLQHSLIARFSLSPDGKQMMEMAVVIEDSEVPASKEVRHLDNVRKTFEGGRSALQLMQFMTQFIKARQQYAAQLDALLDGYLPQAAQQLQDRVQTLK